METKTVRYEGADYPARIITDPRPGPLVMKGAVISVRRLGNLLIKDGMHMNGEAERLDSKILFYVDDDDLTLPDDELAKKVFKTIKGLK